MYTLIIITNFVSTQSKAGLSALPDNPGEFRFWIVSRSVQIGDYNLADNCKSLSFIVVLNFYVSG